MIRPKLDGAGTCTLPLVNQPYWEERLQLGGPCWSENRWLNWEHGIVSRHAIRRVFPRDVSLVLDVGCGDGRFSQWMAKEFGVTVVGTDALEWPSVRKRIPFLQVDAETLAGDLEIKQLGAELVVFMNSLTCMDDWKNAVSAATNIAPRVLCFDNFQTPTPPWWKDLPHRKPIEAPDLTEEFALHGFMLGEHVAADLFHRRLFLQTPGWLHAPVAVLTAVIDLVAAHAINALGARHSALLFERGSVRGNGN